MHLKVFASRSAEHSGNIAATLTRCMLSDKLSAVHNLRWPTEVLSHAFDLLQPGFVSSERNFTRAHVTATATVDHRQYLNFRLVCRKFNNILCVEPWLQTSSMCSQTTTGNFMKKLLSNLEADREIPMLTCFSALPGHAPARAFTLSRQAWPGELQQCHSFSIACLSAFSNQVLCQLHKPAESSSFVRLLLHCHIWETFLCTEQLLPLGDHLTGLSINCADVRCLTGSSARVENLSVHEMARV